MKINVLPSSVRPVLADVHKSSTRMLPFWIGAAATALFSFLFAKVFGWSEELALGWTKEHGAWAFLLTPLAMCASAGIAYWLAPTAAGSGIPQLLAAVKISREPSPLLSSLLSVRMIVAKFVGACVCVAGGGVTGREGPMLQISAGLFHAIQKNWTRFERFAPAPSRQSMILAGGAAGLASAFNTPLGGVIFVIEELANVQLSHVRTYVFHAVVIAGILAQALLGNYLYFGHIEVVSIKLHEILPLVFGMASIGMAGALFGRAIVWLLDRRAALTPSRRFVFTAAMGVMVAAIGFWAGTGAHGSGRAVIVDLLTHPQSSAPFYLFIVRAFANLLTYAGGVVGGVFAPALSTGAAMGSWLSDLVPGWNHQLWTLAGMAAFLTGVTRTPFTSLILVLEMTDTHDIIIYLMLAAIIAQSAALLVDKTSFYEHMSERILAPFHAEHGTNPTP